MSSEIFLRNRDFLIRIRQESYGRARERFRESKALFSMETPPGRNLLKALSALVEELEATQEYASEAIRCLKCNHVKRFRHDPRYGILEEEIVLQHFIDETATLAQFLRNRVETDIKIRLYCQRIGRLQVQDPEDSGFMQKVLESFGGIAQEEVGDLRRLFALMERRYKMGDKLMDILQKKTPDGFTGFDLEPSIDIP